MKDMARDTHHNQNYQKNEKDVEPHKSTDHN